jgi:hypothetical protein
MPYVKRDGAGHITAMFDRPQPDAQEQVPAQAPDVTLFLYGPPGERRGMLASDLELVRVIEDLIELLVGKGLIQFTELPDAVRGKVFQRKDLRRQLATG